MFDIERESSYPTPYSASIDVLTMILLSMAGQKHTPNTTTDIKDAYDYIVVGGGTAGSIVATRLAEKNCATVLLLEAGKSPPKVADIPSISRSFVGSDIDWKYSSAPQKFAADNMINRTVPIPAGKTLGGGSAINVMLNLRGSKKNYDDWAALGAEGWDYDSVLHYFMRLENNTDKEYRRNGYHGIYGPVTVSKIPHDSELKKAVFEAAKKEGYTVGDINGPKHKGFYDIQTTMRDGQRCSTAKAYLVPNEGKDNLAIVKEAFVKKITITNQHARGVVFDVNGNTRFVKAFKEVIISAGSVNTAQLLMLSGIGPREELAKHKIPVNADLPVGKNFQDHWSAFLPFELSSNSTPLMHQLVDLDNINTYINSKSGPLANPFGIASLAFLDTENKGKDADFADIQIYFIEGSVNRAAQQSMNMDSEFYNKYYEPYEGKPFYWCISAILNPKGRGQVTLQSSKPLDPPIIDPKYYSNSDDLEVVVRGLKKCKEFGQSSPLVKLGSKMFNTPHRGCDSSIGNDDEYFRCIAKSFILSLSHPSGTAKMGNPEDPTTVVDPQLRVKGIKNLRVVDASIMPTIPSGNTNVPTMMIAEKASDIIKKDNECFE